MTNEELLQIFSQQQEEFLKLQIVVYGLADTLIESGIVNDKKLEEKINEKVSLVKNMVSDKVKDIEQQYTTMSNLFNGPIGEA